MRTTNHAQRGKHRRVLAALLGALFLAGCAGGSHVGESWQCPIAQGVACQSVSEADPAVASAGEDLKTTVPSPGRSVGTTGSAVLGDLLSWLMKLFSGEEVEEVATAEPLIVQQAVEETPVKPNENLRTKERIARIWIAPYVDRGGVYREGQWVRTVIEPAGWRLP